MSKIAELTAAWQAQGRRLDAHFVVTHGAQIEHKLLGTTRSRMNLDRAYEAQSNAFAEYDPAWKALSEEHMAEEWADRLFAQTTA